MLWHELDRPLKITVLTGILAGTAGMVVVQIQPVDYSAPPISFGLVVGSVLSLIGAFSIILIPMSIDRRGILGLITLVTSFVTVLLSLLTFQPVPLPVTLRYS